MTDALLTSPMYVGVLATKVYVAFGYRETVLKKKEMMVRKQFTAVKLYNRKIRRWTHRHTVLRCFLSADKGAVANKLAR